MKKMMYMIVLLAIGIILVACSEKVEKQLTRIDVQKVDNFEDVMVIKDQKKIDS